MEKEMADRANDAFREALLDSIKKSGKDRLERFTLAAMQGLLANTRCSHDVASVSQDAVSIAKATIAELEKQNGND